MKNKNITILMFFLFLIISGGLILTNFIKLSTSKFYPVMVKGNNLILQGSIEDFNLLKERKRFLLGKDVYFYQISDIKLEEEQYIITLESSIYLQDSIVSIEVEDEKIPLIKLFIRCWEEL